MVLIRQYEINLNEFFFLLNSKQGSDIYFTSCTNSAVFLFRCVFLIGFKPSVENFNLKSQKNHKIRGSHFASESKLTAKNLYVSGAMCKVQVQTCTGSAGILSDQLSAVCTEARDELPNGAFWLLAAAFLLQTSVASARSTAFDRTLSVIASIKGAH